MAAKEKVMHADLPPKSWLLVQNWMLPIVNYYIQYFPLHLRQNIEQYSFDKRLKVISLFNTASSLAFISCALFSKCIAINEVSN